MKKTMAALIAPVALACCVFLDGCQKNEGSSRATHEVVLGFSQIGAESEWRTANTNSIRSAAADAGIRLKFSDAQQKQENQIKALRSTSSHSAWTSLRFRQSLKPDGRPCCARPRPPVFR